MSPRLGLSLVFFWLPVMMAPFSRAWAKQKFMLVLFKDTAHLDPLLSAGFGAKCRVDLLFLFYVPVLAT